MSRAARAQQCSRITMGETTSVDIKQNKRLWTWPNLTFRRGWRKYYSDPLERPGPNWAVYPTTAFDNEQSQTLHHPNAMILAISGRKHGPKLKNNKVWNENARFPKKRGLVDITQSRVLSAHGSHCKATKPTDLTQIQLFITKPYVANTNHQFHTTYLRWFCLVVSKRTTPFEDKPFTSRPPRILRLKPTGTELQTPPRSDIGRTTALPDKT